MNIIYVHHIWSNFTENPVEGLHCFWIVDTDPGTPEHVVVALNAEHFQSFVVRLAFLSLRAAGGDNCDLVARTADAVRKLKGRYPRAPEAARREVVLQKYYVHCNRLLRLPTL